MTAPFTHLTVLQAIVAVGVMASICYYLTALFSAREFFRWAARSRSRSVTDPAPPAVTLLKPLKGLDPCLYENLATFCRQDYGAPIQIVCGVADPDDAAVLVVRRLQRDFPLVDCELVVDGRVYGTNYKVSNLHNMSARARHDVLIISDSDIQVPPDYVRRLVAPLHDPSVGIVSCLYKAVRVGGLPTLVEALFISTDFATSVLVARKVEKPSYAFGATMALRRETLDVIGGFLAVKNYLADDYYLGYLVARRGLKLELSDVIVETVMDVGSWRRLWHHLLRWARTYRTVRPGGYFGSILTHATWWSVLLPIAYGFTPVSLGVGAALIGLRVWAAARICFRYLATDNARRDLLLVPLKDLLVTLVWLTSFLGNRVKWSGRDFRVHWGGEMVHAVRRAGKRTPAIVRPEISAPDSA